MASTLDHIGMSLLCSLSTVVTFLGCLAEFRTSLFLSLKRDWKLESRETNNTAARLECLRRDGELKLFPDRILLYKPLHDDRVQARSAAPDRPQSVSQERKKFNPDSWAALLSPQFSDQEEISLSVLTQNSNYPVRTVQCSKETAANAMLTRGLLNFLSTIYGVRTRRISLLAAIECGTRPAPTPAPAPALAPASPLPSSPFPWLGLLSL